SDTRGIPKRFNPLEICSRTGEINPMHDRIMICGSTAVLHDLSSLHEHLGFEERSKVEQYG
ncbi:MAG: hypothetical protein QM647_15280, partial [Asticcacaulis sp.]